MNAIIKSEKKHFPVLLNELINIISPLYGGTFIDCTFGNGGYSKEILKHKSNKVIAIDRDESVMKIVNKFEANYKNRFHFKQLKFSQLNKLNPKPTDLKGIIFDLGYSLNQIQDKSKGLSFNSDTKLNMRMGLNEFSAHEVINKLEYEHLYKIIKVFGDEQKAKFISRKIIANRQSQKINTQDLVKIIDDVKKYRYTKIHNSTKTFQAIRIFVNNEISELIYGLIESFKLIPLGGIIAVVTFHSIEDKIVKFFFKNYSERKNLSRYLPNLNNKKILFTLKNKKPILPSSKEIKINPPSRSAKLRYAIKIKNNEDFRDFIEKFKIYLDIENIRKKL